MVFNAPAKFPCDICGERREEFYLMVTGKREVILKDAVLHVSEVVYGEGISIRFCTDKGACAIGAAQMIKDHVAKEKANYARSG